MPHVGARERDRGWVQYGSRNIGNMLPVPTYIGNSRPLVSTCADRVSTKAALNSMPRAARESNVSTKANRNMGKLATSSGVRKMSMAATRTNSPFTMPMNAFHTVRPPMIQIRGLGAEKMASTVPHHRSDWMEYPEA
jgi:hypothetical protein